MVHCHGFSAVPHVRLRRRPLNDQQSQVSANLFTLGSHGVFLFQHPQIQKKSQYIKYLCCDDVRTLHQWVNGIRIAKVGISSLLCTKRELAFLLPQEHGHSFHQVQELFRTTSPQFPVKKVLQWVMWVISAWDNRPPPVIVDNDLYRPTVRTLYKVSIMCSNNSSYYCFLRFQVINALVSRRHAYVDSFISLSKPASEPWCCCSVFQIDLSAAACVDCRKANKSGELAVNVLDK